jgi:hypothetical protein
MFLLLCTSELLKYKGGQAIVKYQDPGLTQGWYQLTYDPSTGTPYLGLPCPEVNDFDFEPHLTDSENFVLQNNSEPETPFMPKDKGRQRQEFDDNTA